ncbi:ABC-2 type transport system ATP-binding protein [Saccharopolyspora kobensis]|uniref:ABC-2 type transport system ATP-binding protein n=1 Tax=Saccharopolyspora kobensis TaxID=146035 RepID=A0A1H6EF96_9PSEU|nr:ATP-binding cassette domain-containing protein [Saccharopolyspora kobensis]SEG95514.1 ABC-2 type transport system ATP-binding protein [Saccharopolyspora kobensis]SFD55527.1 ABC-2 type transport system ATP-binding protein [Saccharopolyspora kobensis]
MIEIAGLTKRYGGATAVDDVSFAVEPGVVTGFLGPNGAGKSTTMRMVLGLEEPDAGTALVGGRPYSSLKAPMREVGALLDAGDVHGGRRAAAHLRCIARSNGIHARRVGEVLAEVGLTDVADRRIAGFSLGMRQRLGIAAALLGDPGVLMFDEPINGLDPEGIRWIRELFRGMAAEGRAVLVSSHVMAEMALTADRVVVIGRGRLVADATTDEVLKRFERGVLVKAADQRRLEAVLRAGGADVRAEDGGLAVRGLDAGRIGELALANGIALSELTPRTASLEDAFMELTGGSVEFSAGRAA